MTQQQHDTIRATIIARSDKLALTGYGIWKLVHAEFPDSKMDLSTVNRYLAGRVSLNSRYVSQICTVLGLGLTVKRKAK